MGVRLRPPTERTCERCGRREEWDPDLERWQVARGADGRLAGNVFCLHEWDINGSFVPVDRTE